VAGEGGFLWGGVVGDGWGVGGVCCFFVLCLVV